MLRITKESEGMSVVTLRLEGQIMSTWVQVVECEIGRLLQSEKKVVLDFTEVKVIDSKGANMLKRVIRRDVRIINCPTFIQEFLFNGQK
ncbi:MAG: STAS domain-containing protein [Phycisphaerales bacterium]|nr:STAS domain-containing protein [Phycisphaerales bacterium]